MSSLSPTQLARQAHDREVRALERARDAGEISPQDALVKYRELYAAYQQQKEDLELAAFLNRAGLKPSKHFEKLDRSLAKQAAGDQYFRPVTLSISPDRAA